MNNTEAMPMLFEPGMAPKETIPLCVPEIRGNEWKYVKECLDTNWVSSAGPFVDRFEHAVASYTGRKYAVSTVNGTAALHTALLVAGVEPDDEVILPVLTFIAPANAIRYASAWPIFLDVEPDHWQLDTQKLTEFLERECAWTNGELTNKRTGRRIRAVMPVHILGHPCDMEPVADIARKFGLSVIEDATESLGAEYKGQKIGCYADLGCLSFNGNKIITTGGGGMIVTNNSEWADRAKYLTTQAKDDPIEYVHKEIGYNYRLTNMQAAIGCAQMELLDEFVAIKRDIASTYRDSLGSVPGLTFMKEAADVRSSWWLFTILVNPSEYGMDSRQLLARLAERNIQARPLWQPLHCSTAHAKSQSYRIEVADEIHRAALSLPSSVGLTQADISKVVETVVSQCRPR